MKKSVEAVKSFTKGCAMTDRVCNGQATVIDIFSAFCMASLFGTSSPKTREKYESSIVIVTSDIPSSQFGDTGTPKEIIRPTIGSTKLFAANALAKNPAKVTPT